ncbi:hypothetical protein [Flavobacterium sp.]
MSDKDKSKEEHKKIVKAMEKVYENLILFKKKMNSDLVILKDDKIVRVKP